MAPGTTPIPPGLDREEPELATEDDIPTPSNDDPAQAEEATRVTPPER